MPELDPYLRFGLWPARLAWLADPVLDQLDGRALPEVTTREGASVLEGVGLAQAVRAPVVAVPVLIAAAGLDRANLSGVSIDLVWTVALAVIMVFPMYGIQVGVLQLWLKRSSRQQELVSSAHPRVMLGLRVAPFGAIVMALAFGILLH